MMRKIVLISIISLTCLFAIAAGIAPGDENISQINKLMSDRRFQEAIPLLKEILAKEPSNSDANFKLGLCYYFSPDQKNLALDYFKTAMGDINLKYSFNNAKTTTAPVDIYFFLGEAFLNNHMPDSALYYYIQYKNKVKQESPFDLDARMNWCVNAVREMSSPLNVNIENLGNNINSVNFERNPVVTIDNSVIFFSSTRPKPGANEADKTGGLNEDIYYAIKMPSGNWSKPVYF